MAQNEKPIGLAVTKNWTPRVVSQISLLKLECREISGLHFCCSKNFCTLLLEKDN